LLLRWSLYLREIPHDTSELPSAVRLAFQNPQRFYAKTPYIILSHFLKARVEEVQLVGDAVLNLQILDFRLIADDLRTGVRGNILLVGGEDRWLSDDGRRVRLEQDAIFDRQDSSNPRHPCAPGVKSLSRENLA
jgi:hypothetical protein